MADEIKPLPIPVKSPIGFQSQNIARPANWRERSKWNELLSVFDRDQIEMDRASLLLANIQLTYRFAESQKIGMPDISNINDEYISARSKFDELKEAIRGVEDHRFGIRLTTDGKDIDIMKPGGGDLSGALSGLIIPVIVGGIIVAGAIGDAWYQTKVNIELFNKYRSLLENTNRVFCYDKSSKLCQDWQSLKTKNNYDQNIKMADSLSGSLSGGVKKIAGSVGVALGVGIVAAIILRRI